MFRPRVTCTNKTPILKTSKSRIMLNFPKKQGIWTGIFEDFSILRQTFQTVNECFRKFFMTTFFSGAKFSLIPSFRTKFYF